MIFMIVFVIIMTVTILLDAFIFNPLEVGCKRFYLRNLNEAALVGNAGYAFDNNYKNIAKTMFSVICILFCGQCFYYSWHCKVI